MNALIRAAADLQTVCESHQWRFCFIGGLAVLRWGEPRETVDVDLTLITGFGHESEFVSVLTKAFQPRIDDAAAFAQVNRVLLLVAASGVGKGDPCCVHKCVSSRWSSSSRPAPRSPKADKVWFFSAGRFQNNSTGITAPFTGFNYTKVVSDKRGEGKLTYTPSPGNTVKVSYLRKTLSTTNNSFSTIMDAASLYNDRTVESLAANYQTVLGHNLFIETQYSARKLNLLGQGSSFCAACPNYANILDNWDVYAKLNYFLSPFVNDTWRVNRRITLNVGLRNDKNAPPDV